MPHRIRPFLPIVCLFALASSATVQADPLADLKSFSAFKEVNLEKLASGTVLAARGAAMSSPRDLAVESCYVVRKPLQKAGELHLQWSPARHPQLKVYLHGEISASPTPAQFQKVATAPANSAVKWLASATEKLAGGTGDLQLSAAESKTFKPVDGRGGAFPSDVASFWSTVLFQRASAFLSGGLTRLPPYEFKGETIRTSEEVARLIKGASKVRGQFSSLIDATPLGGGKGSLAPSPYWEMFDVEGEAAFNLGALYYRPAPASWQVVEIQYYASGGYYTLLTFYQMWPVTVGGQECTLVWRVDLMSSAALASLHGVERMGSSTAMMRETQKSIKSLLDDASK
jgi:hypothetical protein